MPSSGTSGELRRRGGALEDRDLVPGLDGSLRYRLGKRRLMDLSQAPAFVPAKMAMLSDARAAAATRADELTGQISHVRDRLNGRVVREGDHAAELRIELVVFA